MRTLDCYTKHVLLLLAITHCRIASPHQYRTTTQGKDQSICNFAIAMSVLVFGGGGGRK